MSDPKKDPGQPHPGPLPDAKKPDTSAPPSIPSASSGVPAAANATGKAPSPGPPVTSGPAPPTREPGQGIPGIDGWGDPKSVPAYGHSRSQHGAQKLARDFEGRAGGTQKPIGQWLDNQFIVEAEQRAPLGEGRHLVDMGKPVGREFQPDGSVKTGVTKARVIRRADNTVITSYPVI